MSIAEMRSCTAFARRIDVTLYGNKDPIKDTVKDKTVQKFKESEDIIGRFGLNHGDATGATVYFQAARWKNIAVLDYLCSKAQPQWLALGTDKGLIPLHAPWHELCNKEKNPPIVYSLLTFGSPINITTNAQWFHASKNSTALDMALKIQDWTSACILKFNGGLCNLTHSAEVESTLNEFIAEKESEAAMLSNRIVSCHLFIDPIIDIIAKYAVSEFNALSCFIVV